MSLLSLLLPALMPAAADAIRAIVARISGGAGGQPQNVDESIKLMDAGTRRLQALAELDKPAANISVWVANLRASFRYIAIGAIELAAIGAVFAGIEAPALMELAGAGMSFIIGERMYLAVGGRAK